MLKILNITKKVILKKRNKGSKSAYIMNDNLLYISPLKVPKKQWICESFIDIVSKPKKQHHFFKKVHVFGHPVSDGRP